MYHLSEEYSASYAFLTAFFVVLYLEYTRFSINLICEVILADYSLQLASITLLISDFFSLLSSAFMDSAKFAREINGPISSRFSSLRIAIITVRDSGIEHGTFSSESKYIRVSPPNPAIAAPMTHFFIFIRKFSLIITLVII